ncbi:MAG: amino acid ABC transporter ATP-binding protein [Arenicellales bacterium]|jgi:ABC-type polar amino acid transport system ATPase subunit|nr:amino acid ABC transporter ATP-binding protein [Arenicellales bacterium]|tara:strand:+ start:543 stop:1310 length:768 start_codon:yes stop_codon:yes gene_type:complete
MNIEQNGNRSDRSFIVEIRDVQKSFGSLHVIRGISLTIENGQVVVICGPSGCGKSTLLRCINGLEPIDSGDIIVGGISVKEKNRLRELRTETGMVFQQFNLFPHKTVLENVMLAPVDIRKMNKPEAKNLARSLLDRVGILNKEDDLPASLSGGQQQRVAIARGLAMNPKLMMFDEPTSALDPEMIKEVLDVMRNLASDGMTMIVVSHEMGFAREVADWMVMMDEGQIIEGRPPGEFFGNPREERTQQFLSQIISH